MQSANKYLDPFDRSSGSGARSTSDDWVDDESIFTNQWGSTAATTFDPSDASAAHQNRFERLYELQNGKGEQSRKQTIRSSHVENDAETFMSVLELPSKQRQEVRDVLAEIDIGSTNFGPRGKYEKIILAICSLISDRSLSQQSNPSIQDRLLFTDKYRDLMEATGMSSTDHRKLRVSIREKSDYF